MKGGPSFQMMRCVPQYLQPTVKKISRCNIYPERPVYISVCLFEVMTIKLLYGLFIVQSGIKGYHSGKS